jgi:A/G-specific adenine glycosylase
MNSELNALQLPRLRRALLRWYDLNKRDLPWRNTRDPYRIWVSEIMLQQTRVAAVVPRYERFLARFPSVQALSSAKPASVLAEWSGLGYYHRARSLRAAARLIAREHRGVFPETAKSLSELPGIGRYTAAAIASIAYGEAVAAVDGNVERILRRLLRDQLAREESWSAAQRLLDHARPGDFNQAMMELGATVCLPHQPACDRCPIRNFCCTKGRGPASRQKKPQRKASICYGLSTRKRSVLLVRRSPNTNLMPGMWELPQVRNRKSPATLFTLRHSITVTDYLVTVIAQPAPSLRGARWISIGKAAQLPLTGLAKKILRKANIIE